jgi:hypothetical protein
LRGVVAELIRRVQTAALHALDKALAGERDAEAFRHPHLRYLQVVKPFRRPTEWL